MAIVLTLLFGVLFAGFTATYFGRYRRDIGDAFFSSFGESIRYASALTEGPICVTDNVAEFKRVPALKVENWLARQSGAQ